MTYPNAKSIDPRPCPMCGKQYIPAPLHIYHIILPNTHPALVCSYKCQRKWEREKEAKIEQKKESAR